MSERKPLYMSCFACGAAWLFAHTPCDADQFCGLLKRACCPHCHETKRIGFGDPTVTAPREPTKDIPHADH